MAATTSNIVTVPATQLTPNQVIDHFWWNTSQNMGCGARRDIVLDLTWRPVIGDNGVREMANRYQEFIQAPVTITEDASRNQLKLAPTFNPLGHDVQVSQTRVDNQNGKVQKITRPRNAFILFRQHYHNQIKNSEPGIHNNQISKRLGEAWNHASSDEKERFREMAEVEKIEHMQKHPGYVYQPRKPNEKKRRMTRRKREAMMTEDMSLPKTRYGNVVLEFGSKSRTVKNLRAKLEKHNSDLPAIPARMNRLLNLSRPASIYTERTQEFQDQHNFYTALSGACIDPQLLVHPGNPFEQAPNAAITATNEVEQFDEDEPSFFNAELERMDLFE